MLKAKRRLAQGGGAQLEICSRRPMLAVVECVTECVTVRRTIWRPGCEMLRQVVKVGYRRIRRIRSIRLVGQYPPDQVAAMTKPEKEEDVPISSMFVS